MDEPGIWDVQITGLNCALFPSFSCSYDRNQMTNWTSVYKSTVLFWPNLKEQSLWIRVCGRPELRAKEQTSKADVEGAWEEICKGKKKERKKQEVVFKDRLKKKHLKSSGEGQNVSRSCSTWTGQFWS